MKLFHSLNNSLSENINKFSLSSSTMTGINKNFFFFGIDGKIRPLRETLESPGGGSTDVGDVSYNVPVVSLAATTAPKGVPWHSWSVVASSGMSIGHKGMLHAAKALGMSMIDIYKDKKLREEIKKEFDERIGDYNYEPYLNPGPPPIDYVD